ncbi:MAG: hypothetical protein ACREOM_00150 [Candidatus Dormibacteraceae bacterium]
MRSRRSILTLGAAGLACALVFGVVAAVAFEVRSSAIAGIPLLAGALCSAAVTVWEAIHLTRWPSGKLALFRDRLVVIQGRHEVRAVWALMETITLAEPSAWPDLRLTDRLTIHSRNEAPITFRPSTFGLEPVACRDLILRLRDDSKLRSRLPEFDSARDLAMAPVVAGELIEPRL